MRKLASRMAWAGVVVWAMSGSAAQAASTNTKFAPTMQVQGMPLQLNGAGTRFKAIFKVYDLGLYTQTKVHTPEELLALPGPKRLQFTALRELSTGDLGRLFMRAVADNSPPELVQKHAIDALRLIDVFSSRSRLQPGDAFAMDFLPGKGPQFYLLGVAQGEPVGDAEFGNMVLKIWVGPSPADYMLKDALLGKHDQ